MCLQAHEVSGRVRLRRSGTFDQSTISKSSDIRTLTREFGL
jgi:hypothetical protein